MNIQLNKTNPINKILVVGHPLSSYQEVEALLNISGMNRAQPSRRDGFLPSDISTTLCKAHRIPVFNTLDAGAEIKQLEVSPMWNGMALDLFLGNINQEFWGWADSQSVYLLDYWKSVDPQIAFVLVYDTPQQLIAQAFDAQMAITPETLHRATSNWASFNSALLHFYHRNPERCLLVHAQQVRESASSYLQQVRTRIGAPVLADCPSLVIVEVDGISPNCVQETTQATLKAYLANELIQQQPESQQLYEELQSVANLPLAKQITTGYSPLDAWISMASHQTQHKELLTQAQVRTQAQTAQIETISRSLTGAQTVAIEKQQQIARLEQDQVTDRQRIQEREQASALVTVELHQAQEDLGRCYVEGEHQLERIKGLLVTEKLAIERAQVIAQLCQEKAQLSADKDDRTKLADERASRVEQISQQLTDARALSGEKQHHIEHLEQEQVTDRERIQALQQDSKLVVLQLHQVQEDLERRYVESQHQQEKINALRATEILAAERAQAIEQLSQEKAKLSADRDDQTKLAEERASRVEQISQQLTDAQALADEKQQHIARLEQGQATDRQRIQGQQQESELVVLQLHQVQEDLERCYVEGQHQQEQIKALQKTEIVATERAQVIERLSQEKAKLSADKDNQTKLAKQRASRIEQISQQLTGAQADAGERQQHISRLEQEQVTDRERIQAQQQESELVVLQLHQVQVDLERRYVEGQHQQEKINALQATEILATERGQAIEQLSQEKAKLSADKDNQTKLAKQRASRIEQISQQLTGAQADVGERQQHIARLEQDQAVDRQRIRAQQQQSELVVLQLHQMQENLERRHVEGQQQQEKIKKLTQASDLQITLNSKNAKQLEQLSQAKATHEKLDAKRKQQVQQLTQNLEVQTQLAEAQAVQIKENTAKPAVDNAEQQQENDLLLLQLHQVQEELERYYLKNKQSEQKPAIRAKLLKNNQYGAAERVKRQLSYRLGASMVTQSRSIGGCLVMPWALLKQLREFRRDEKARGNVRLPAIENYYDAHEAEKVKKHLSYRLGAAMVANASSPLGWLKMPWTLRREVLIFQKQLQRA